MSVLENLSDFPLNTDKVLQEYYEKIANKIINYDIVPLTKDDNSKYYIQKIKPFFVNNNIFYEITFITARDYESKFNRIIAFTKIDMIDNYASRFHLVKENIEILGKSMPITIITGWNVAIRNCEFKNFVYVITGEKENIFHEEQMVINKYITISRKNLCDLVNLSDNYFNKLIQEWKSKLKSKSTIFIQTLEVCRKIIKNKSRGHNVLRYLLYCLNNLVIKKQTQLLPNEKISNLYLDNGCIPFDNMPFINSLKEHNPKIWSLLYSITINNRENELFARFVKNNAEIKCELFTRIKDIERFNNIEELVQKYNSSLWWGHYDNSKLVIENGQVFINGYKNDTCFIIDILKKLSKLCLKDYSLNIETWLNNSGYVVDCSEKNAILKSMFSLSCVAIIYGAAGTGKSTLINHVSHFFRRNKLYLTQTNAALDNLKRKINAENTDFYTINKFLYRKIKLDNYDLVVIDECSTVSNKDMKELLNRGNITSILLVGDTYQILFVLEIGLVLLKN